MIRHPQAGARLGRASAPPRTPAARNPVTELRFPGTDLTIRLTNAPDVRQALSDATHGWRAQVAMRGPHSAITCVTGARGGYRATSPFEPGQLKHLGVAQATCAVLADLSESWLAAHPGMLALHCGAFHMGGGLVMLAGPMRAGKSTLIARLTAEPDVTVFCDDVLPLSAEGEGIALGIAPRLRLPLPARTTPAFRRHVAQSAGPRDRRYAYLPTANLAPHGSRAPLSALVVLDRRPSGGASLHRLPADQAMRHLLERNMAHLGCAGTALDLAERMLKGLSVVRMVYSDLDDAVCLLRRTFAPGQPQPDLPPVPEIATPVACSRPAEQAVNPRRIWRQRPDAGVRCVGDSVFLWSPAGEEVWHLNPTAHAIWAALTIPGSVAEVADLLAEIHPDRAAKDLLRDVSDTMSRLADQNFLLACDA